MDVDLGKVVGCNTILIKQGDEIVNSDAVAADLLEAAREIFAWKGEVS